jgi:hypothetical protein
VPNIALWTSVYFRVFFGKIIYRSSAKFLAIFSQKSDALLLTNSELGNIWAILGNIWAILGNFGQLWATFGNFWQLWATFERFFHKLIWSLC